MKLLIIGATGQTGKLLVEQGLAQGHDITAFVRNPAAITLQHDHLTVACGDVLNTLSIATVLPEQDAVLCALGEASPSKPSTLVSAGTENIVHAMEQQHVRRFICITVLGVGDGKRHASWLANQLIGPFFLKHVLADKERQEQVIRRSTLDWVMVRPPFLLNGPAKGRYRVLLDEPGIVNTIRRADVADFMLTQVISDQYVCQAPVIGY